MLVRVVHARVMAAERKLMRWCSCTNDVAIWFQPSTRFGSNTLHLILSRASPTCCFLTCDITWLVTPRSYSLKSSCFLHVKKKSDDNFLSRQNTYALDLIKSKRSLFYNFSVKQITSSNLYFTLIIKCF